MLCNNGWTAILAIWAVLPILGNGLAGEHLPPNYGDTKLRGNASKAAYRAYGGNAASGHGHNRLPTVDEQPKLTAYSRWNTANTGRYGGNLVQGPEAGSFHRRNRQAGGGTEAVERDRSKGQREFVTATAFLSPDHRDKFEDYGKLNRASVQESPKGSSPRGIFHEGFQRGGNSSGAGHEPGNREKESSDPVGNRYGGEEIQRGKWKLDGSGKNAATTRTLRSLDRGRSGVHVERVLESTTTSFLDGEAGSRAKAPGESRSGPLKVQEFDQTDGRSNFFRSGHRAPDENGNFPGTGSPSTEGTVEKDSVDKLAGRRSIVDDREATVPVSSAGWLDKSETNDGVSRSGPSEKISYNEAGHDTSRGPSTSNKVSVNAPGRNMEARKGTAKGNADSFSEKGQFSVMEMRGAKASRGAGIKDKNAVGRDTAIDHRVKNRDSSIYDFISSGARAPGRFLQEDATAQSVDASSASGTGIKKVDRPANKPGHAVLRDGTGDQEKLPKSLNGRILDGKETVARNSEYDKLSSNKDLIDNSVSASTPYRSMETQSIEKEGIHRTKQRLRMNIGEHEEDYVPSSSTTIRPVLEEPIPGHYSSAPEEKVSPVTQYTSGTSTEPIQREKHPDRDVSQRGSTGGTINNFQSEIAKAHKMSDKKGPTVPGRTTNNAELTTVELSDAIPADARDGHEVGPYPKIKEGKTLSAITKRGNYDEESFLESERGGESGPYATEEPSSVRPRGSIAGKRNATYLRTDMAGTVDELEASGTDGGKNARRPFENLKASGVAARQSIAKNSKMGKLDAEFGRSVLEEGVDRVDKDSVDLRTGLPDRNADKTQRVSTVAVSSVSDSPGRNGSISLAGTSNVLEGGLDRGAGNYGEGRVVTKSEKKLNDSSGEARVIASSGGSPDQNKAAGRPITGETRDNESIERSSWVEGPSTKSIEHFGNKGSRYAYPEGTKGTEDPAYRWSKMNIFEVSTVPSIPVAGSPTGRRSRSSRKDAPPLNRSTTAYSQAITESDEARAASTTRNRIGGYDGGGTRVTSPGIDSGPSGEDSREMTTSTPRGTLDRSTASRTGPPGQTGRTIEIDGRTLGARTPAPNPRSDGTTTGNYLDRSEKRIEPGSSDRVFPPSVGGVGSERNESKDLEPRDQWPVKKSAVVEGELVLGGLMMVHEREDSVTCGPVMPQGGVQALEAMLYTLDMLNDRGIVPGVKIGAHILDDCDKDTYGLEMAVDFIKGSISNIDGAEYHCNKTAVRKVISGVVGAASSVTSIQVANLLRLFRIPQVSFFSTSPELSNKQRFEYFSRTIPSDHYQVKAMVDIVLTMGWSYVSIIYEESNYGIKAFEELEELLGKYDICIAIKEKLVKDSGVAEETAYDNIVLKLLTKPRARGCIIFGSDQEVAGVMRAVRRCNATGAFSWIGSDGWSARGLVSNGNEPEVEGTLSVQPQANPVRGFEEYFLNLTVENNRRNPWFVEFWEDHFKCRYPNASWTPYNQKYTKPCTTKERLTKADTAFEDQLQFVSDAVMAFAYAFRDMHNDLCHGKAGLCDAMKPTKGEELLKYLRKVDFEGLSGDKFRFDKNGDGPARYNIIHFKQTEPGKYKWIRVGKYLEGELRLNMSEIQFKLGHPQPPESVCSLPCEVGQAKKYVEGERCCWHCFNCTQYQIRHPQDETQCIPCQQGTVPDETHSTCRDIPEEFLRPESGWAIGAMSFSSTGILITLFVCGVFLKHNDTPIVRASGRELSYVLLSGILLCYLVTFALVIRPTNIVCGIQRFAAGFCFTVVYAALLTKTNRISRIFNAGKHSAKRPSFISPRSQLIICSGLVFVQILINGVWMIIDPARAMHHYPTREDNFLVCNSYIDASYMIAFAYPIMLIVVCTVYAVLTRKIPEAFNESKHIGFTMYTTCVIWLAFVPLYFGTGNNVALRITSMSVTISLSASVTIACLFGPKLYIILIRPDRNVRQSIKPVRYSTTKSSAVTATNASSIMAPVTLTAATCDQNKAVKKHIITTIDCSTQSEYYELEVKDQKNGKPPPSVVSRSTQTTNNEKEPPSAAATGNKDTKESSATAKQLNNNTRIGNGPVNQSDVSL